LRNEEKNGTMNVENKVDKKIDSFFEDLAQNDKKVQEEIYKTLML
jgi:hypothetical protein